MKRLGGLSSEVQRAENLYALLSHADYVSLHVPAIEATKHMINEEALAQAKPGLTLLNFARESIVDPQAIAAALDSGRVCANTFAISPSLFFTGGTT